MGDGGRSLLWLSNPFSGQVLWSKCENAMFGYTDDCKMGLKCVQILTAGEFKKCQFDDAKEQFLCLCVEKDWVSCPHSPDTDLYQQCNYPSEYLQMSKKDRT